MLTTFSTHLRLSIKSMCTYLIENIQITIDVGCKVFTGSISGKQQKRMGVVTGSGSETYEFSGSDINNILAACFKASSKVILIDKTTRLHKGLIEC